MFTIRCRIGRGLRPVEDGEEVRMDRGLAAGNLHDVRLTFVAHDGVDQPLDVVERPVLRAATGRSPRSRSGIAGCSDR